MIHRNVLSLTGNTDSADNFTFRNTHGRVIIIKRISLAFASSTTEQAAYAVRWLIEKTMPGAASYFPVIVEYTNFQSLFFNQSFELEPGATLRVRFTTPVIGVWQFEVEYY